MKKYAALFIREDSAYKKRDSFDCYDSNRDARKFKGGIPVACHPPCRCWSALAHMSFRSLMHHPEMRAAAMHVEKKLAILSVSIVRSNGGVLEHPSKSSLFKSHLPDAGHLPDEFGGFTIEVDQFDFGHVASKPTKLYICGIHPSQLPDLPKKRSGAPTHSITGQVGATKRCTQYQREYTPELLIDWIESVLTIISK